MITVEDLRNSGRKSGFKYVTLNLGSTDHPKPWVATLESSASGATKRGPRRATPEEAAQDYVDYANGAVVPPGWTSPTVDMGNVKDHHVPSDAGVTVHRPQYEGPHDLYDVLLVSANGDVICRKVGITKAATLRYADICKTFGISIRPVQAAVTYPSKQEAADAETKRVTTVAQDPQWRRIAKEAFAPT